MEDLFFLARLAQRAAGSQPATHGLCGCAFNTRGVALWNSLPQRHGKVKYKFKQYAEKEVKKMQRVCRNCKFCLVDPSMEEYDPDPFYCDLTVEKTDPEHECRFFEGFEPKTIEKR